MEGFYEEVVPGMTEDQFRANFRLTRTTTAKAMEVTHKPPIFRKKLLLFLYYLGSIVSFRKVATVFGVSVSTAWEYVSDVVATLVGLKHDFIKFPLT